MSELRPAGADLLRGGIATTLRIGTLVAVLLVGAGWAWSLATGDAALDQRSVLDLVGGGGAGMLIGLGLIGLTFLPLAVLGLAIAGFRRSGEARLATISGAVLALLVVSLVVTAIIGAVGR